MVSPEQKGQKSPESWPSLRKKSTRRHVYSTSKQNKEGTRRISFTNILFKKEDRSRQNCHEDQVGARKSQQGGEKEKGPFAASFREPVHETHPLAKLKPG